MLAQLHERFVALLAHDLPGPHNVTPKVMALLDALIVFERPPNFVGICFVQLRHHCAILAALLKMTLGLKDMLTVDILVGHDSGSAKSGKKAGRKSGGAMSATQVRQCLIC